MVTPGLGLPQYITTPHPSNSAHHSKGGVRATAPIPPPTKTVLTSSLVLPTGSTGTCHMGHTQLPGGGDTVSQTLLYTKRGSQGLARLKVHAGLGRSTVSGRGRRPHWRSYFLSFWAQHLLEMVPKPLISST